MYRYSALKEKDSIRLLRIQPANEINADLRLSIVKTTLSSITTSADGPLTFTALSYFWGPQVDLKPVYINVDEAGSNNTNKSIEELTTKKREDPTQKSFLEFSLGSCKQAIKRLAGGTPKREIQEARNNLTNPTSTKELRVGSNLHSALRHLRRKTADVIVWADGLCINQHDARERNHQVRHMRVIYERASKTVVYLGDEGGNTCLSAWNFLERGAAGEGDKGRDSLMGFRGDLGDVEINVLSRPWFRRVWVVQEVAVSRNIIMKCGTRSIPWDDFCKIVLLEPRVNDRYGFSLRNKKLFEYVAELFLTRCAFLISHGLQHILPPWYNAIEDSKSRSNQILDMVVRSRHLEATDPRDKVFALIGISSGVDPEDTRIAIDYSKSLKRVYIDFAVYLMDSKLSLDVLSHSNCGSDLVEFMPGWVPDWRRSPGSPRTILSSLPLESEEENRQRRQIIRKNHHHRQAVKQLRCYGEIIGKISNVTENILLRGNDELALEQIRQEFKARPQQMRAQILEMWKTLPWMRVNPGEKYDSVPKGSSDASSARPSSHLEWTIRRPQYMSSLWNRIVVRLNEECSLVSAESIQDEKTQSKEQQSKSIVDHLIHRSRQTLLWTDDRSLAIENVIDKTSIIDNRRLGLFHKRNMDLNSSSENVVLAPAATQVGDYVVSLNGGRVAFVIRMSGKSGRLRPRLFLDNPPKRVQCVLIGECLINSYGIFDTGSGKFNSSNPTRKTSFSFEDWNEPESRLRRFFGEVSRLIKKSVGKK